MEQQHLRSHLISPADLATTVAQISERIQQQGDKPHASVARQLELLNQLQQFDFGRYLLQNRGLNGYWTHYALTHPGQGRLTGLNNAGLPFTALEDFLLNKAMSATQQRFQIFLAENQKCVKNNAQLACIPCGMMGELLYLNYDNIQEITLTGIDYDNESLQLAHDLAKTKNLSQFTEFSQQDAWHLNNRNQFDLISSNGLNIYEPDAGKVQALYQQFYHALKPGGKLVTSFLTFPPSVMDQSEWEISKLDYADWLLQVIIFVDIIDTQFKYFQTSTQMLTQLQAIGFKNIEFIYDEVKIFPTVVAYK